MMRFEQLEPRKMLTVFTVDVATDAVDFSPGDGVCSSIDGDCTLRAAIQEANESGAEVTIEFAQSLNATPIQLDIPGTDEDQNQAGDLDITAKNLRIQGNGPIQTVIQGSIADRVFHVHESASVQFEGMVIQGGGNVYYGGGILNQGSTRINLAFFFGNSAVIGEDIFDANGQADYTIATFIGDYVKGNGDEFPSASAANGEDENADVIATTVVTEDDAPAQAESIVESTTFFEYNSAELDSTDIAEFNRFAGETGPNPNRQYQYHLPSDFGFWHTINHQLPSMNRNGKLVFQRKAGDKDSHTLIRGYDFNKTDAFSHETCDNNTTLKLDETYEFEFDLTIPENTNKWWESVNWMIFFELWGWFDSGTDYGQAYGDSAVNPAFALSIVADPGGVEGTHLKVTQRGSSVLHHSSYETEEHRYIPLEGAGDYHFKIQYRGDYRKNGDGVSRVWLDGESIWSHEGQTAYNSLCKETHSGPVPYMGVYSVDRFSGRGIEVQFDNVEHRMLGELAAPVNVPVPEDVVAVAESPIAQEPIPEPIVPPASVVVESEEVVVTDPPEEISFVEAHMGEPSPAETPEGESVVEDNTPIVTEKVEVADPPEEISFVDAHTGEPSVSETPVVADEVPQAGGDTTLLGAEGEDATDPSSAMEVVTESQTTEDVGGEQPIAESVVAPVTASDEEIVALPTPNELPPATNPTGNEPDDEPPTLPDTQTLELGDAPSVEPTESNTAPLELVDVGPLEVVPVSSETQPKDLTDVLLAEAPVEEELPVLIEAPIAEHIEEEPRQNPSATDETIESAPLNPVSPQLVVTTELIDSDRDKEAAPEDVPPEAVPLTTEVEPTPESTPLEPNSIDAAFHELVQANIANGEDPHQGVLAALLEIFGLSLVARPITSLKPK